MNASTIISTLAFVHSLVATVAGQTTWYVDDNAVFDPAPGDPTIGDPQENGSEAHPFDSIQEAILASLSGDIIKVRDGLYSGNGNRNLLFGGKQLTVESENGPQSCILDAGGTSSSAQRHIELNPTDSHQIIVRGLTFSGGRMGGNTTAKQQGGAISCIGTNPLIENCVFTGNFALQQGGAVFLQDSGAQLKGCTFAGNNTATRGGALSVVSNAPIIESCNFRSNSSGAGGAVYIADSTATILTSIIESNSATSGGGIYLSSGSPTVEGCTISRNVSLGWGGGLVAYQSNSHISGCVISRNRAREDGGGVWIRYGTAQILDSAFLKNLAYEQGGGMYIDTFSGSTIDRCTISGNRAFRSGGFWAEWSYSKFSNCVIAGNYASYSAAGYGATMTNCTIVRNEAYKEVGGVQAWFIHNCIVRDNTPTELLVPIGFYPPEPTYCNIKGGYPGSGNIDLDPQFAYDDDVHLTSLSPCRDAGSSDPPIILPATDHAGRPRVFPPGGAVDIGAYEYHSDAPSLATSTNELEYFIALDDSSSHDRPLAIRNAGGMTLQWQVMETCPWLTVTPMLGVSDDESVSMVVTASAAGLSHGDYACQLAIASNDQQRPSSFVEVTLHVNQTIHVPKDYASISEAVAASVDGDQISLAPGIYQGPSNRGTNLFDRLLTLRCSGNTDQCVIDGNSADRLFLLEGVRAPGVKLENLTLRNARTADGLGAAVKSIVSHLSTSNCILTQNRGEAIQLVGGEMSSEFCTFSNNQGVVPGVVDLYGARATLLDCEISSNSSAGVYVQSGVLTMGRCTVESNMGSGLNAIDTELYLEDSSILNNRARDGGGLSLHGLGHTYIARVIVEGNTATDRGGGAFINDLYGRSVFADVLIHSSRFAYNNALTGGGIAFQQANSGTKLDSLVIHDNSAVKTGGGLESYFGDPIVSNCTIANNTAGQAGGGVSSVRGLDLQDGTFSGIQVADSIIWGNAAPSGPQVGLVPLDSLSGPLGNSVASFQFCDIKGGLHDAYIDSDCGNCSFLWGSGNIDIDPIFVDPGKGDFHLNGCSPCIDQADPAQNGLGRVDLDGESRKIGGRIDLGADEFSGMRPDCRLPGDFDGDGYWTLDDVAMLVSCLSGPQVQIPPSECTVVDFPIGDLGADGDSDLEDIAHWLRGFQL